MVKFDPKSDYHQQLFVMETSGAAALTLALLGSSDNIGKDATQVVIDVVKDYAKAEGLATDITRVSLYDAQQIMSRLCLKLHKMLEEQA